MELVREIVSLGRAARMGAKLKVRQPLAKVEVILAHAADRADDRAWLESHAALVADELNVKSVELATRADQYVSYVVLPDLKKLGPRLGKRLPEVKQALAKADAAALLAALDESGQAALELPSGNVSLDRSEIQVRLEAKPGWAAAQSGAAVVVLATELNDALLAEGWARELVHAVQTERKQLGCEYTERIRLGLIGPPALADALKPHVAYICEETLAVELRWQALAGVEAIELELGPHAAQLFVEKTKTPAP